MKNKSLEAITEIVDGKMTVIASTETDDRMGDSLKVNDWDFRAFKKNPVLQAGHDYRPQFTIGIAKNIRVEGNKVLFEPEFHNITALAREIKEMFEQGMLKAWSVGFIPGREEGDKNELLEISAVAVPANSEALVIAKGMNQREEKDLSGKIKEFVKEKVEHVNEDINESKILEKKFVGRVNKQLPKFFDRVYIETKGLKQDTELSLYKKHLRVEVKDIYVNTFSIPMPLIGSYLSAHKNVFDEQPIETRRFNWQGIEHPPVYQDIKLNSTKRDSLLVEGISFYNKGIIYKVYPVFMGMIIEVITSVKHREANVEMMNDIHKWVDENNFLKGEKFSITGEFLQLNKKSWEDLYVDIDTEKTLKRLVKMSNKEDFASRGILMYGPPGNGKTLTGKIMMNEIKSSCIWITAKDFSNTYMHPSGTIALAYKLAKMLGTTVVFMEDIDNWLKGQTTDALKTEMDGLSENRGVLTVLTSNEPENLPDALLDRPGRFHDILKYDVPNSSIRKKMLNKLVKLETKTLDDIVSKTTGYSGAYMKELVDLSLLISKEEEVSMNNAIDEAFKKIEKQKKLIQEIRDKNKEEASKKVFDNILLKEGRVISKKNQKIILDTINKTKETAVALEKLLKISEPTPNEDSEKSVPEAKLKKVFIKRTSNKEQKGTAILKVEEPKKVHKELSVGELAVQTLKLITKQSSFVLNKHNKEKK